MTKLTGRLIERHKPIRQGLRRGDEMRHTQEERMEALTEGKLKKKEKARRTKKEIVGVNWRRYQAGTYYTTYQSRGKSPQASVGAVKASDRGAAESGCDSAICRPHIGQGL